MSCKNAIERSAGWCFLCTPAFRCLFVCSILWRYYYCTLVAKLWDFDNVLAMFAFAWLSFLFRPLCACLFDMSGLVGLVHYKLSVKDYCCCGSFCYSKCLLKMLLFGCDWCSAIMDYGWKNTAILYDDVLVWAIESINWWIWIVNFIDWFNEWIQYIIVVNLLKYLTRIQYLIFKD